MVSPAEQAYNSLCYDFPVSSSCAVPFSFKILHHTLLTTFAFCVLEVWSRVPEPILSVLHESVFVLQKGNPLGLADCDTTRFCPKVWNKFLIHGWVEQVVDTAALAALATSYKCGTELGRVIGVHVDVMLDLLNL